MPDRELDFRALFDAAPSLYLVLLPNDPIFTIVAANDAYTKAILLSKEEVVGRGLFELFRDSPNLRASLRQVISDKAKQSMPAQKYDICRPESLGGGFQEPYWSAVNSPLLGDDGEVRFIIHRVENVSELLVVEEKPLASEAAFSLAFAQAPIGMVLLSPEGRLLEVNQAFVDMLGYAREELISGDSSLFTHPDDTPLTRNFFKSLQQGPHNTGSIEKRYLPKGGEILWARASATMRRDPDGRPAQVIAIVENISERKRAEIRYRFLAESIPQMVWTATPDGMLDYVNGPGSAYFGRPQEALLGGQWLQLVHPDEQASTVERWMHSIETGTPYETSFRLKRGCDDSWRWHLVRALPLTGDHGKIVQWFGTCTDIEDQRQADANLRQQWQAFDTALSHTPDFSFTFDLDGRFTYANRALLSLLQKSLEETCGKTFADLEYPAELAERLQLQIQQVINTRQPIRDQTPFAGPTGESRYYEYIFVPVFDAYGGVKAVAGSTRDITEQNQAARQIEDDRGRWRELLLQTPAGIAILGGPEHNFEWVNSEYARLVGRPAELLVGKSVQVALPEVESQSYVELLNGVYLTGEPFTGHELLVRLDRGDGSLQDVYVNFVYLPTKDASGRINGVFVHVTDVTAMVVARQHVEESERQFRTLAETIPHLAWMADQTGHIFWYNRRWYEYTGTTLPEIEGWGWEKLHDPKVLPEVVSKWRRAIAIGEPFEMVFPLRGADGEFRSFLTRIEPVKDSQGQVVRWFGTNTDITDQRKTEEELRRINRELEEFAYVASHDLQEPLRMVNIYTQLILRDPQAPKAKLEQFSAFIQQGVKRMETLIHDLLTFSRTIHTEELPVGTAELSASLAESLSVLKDRIDESGAVIEASNLPSVRGDTSQMAHVFQNVLSNALKYHRAGVPPEIFVSSKQDGERWIISVRDNGIGFDPMYADRIFGLFKRLHKDEYPGTGLGLAICKRIVERYGGRMWAESRVGEGATFYFSLPRAGHADGGSADS